MLELVYSFNSLVSLHKMDMRTIFIFFLVLKLDWSFDAVVRKKGPGVIPNNNLTRGNLRERPERELRET